MQRRAVTLVEALIAACLTTLIAGILTGFCAMGYRMSGAAASSAAVQRALLLQEALFADIRQLGVDPAAGEVLRLRPEALSFHRVSFDGDEVRLLPLRWAAIGSPGRNKLLERTEIDASGASHTHVYADAPLAAVEFTRLTDEVVGGAWLRVRLEALDVDRPPGSPGVTATPHVMVVRVPVPGQLGNPALSLASRVTPIAPLFPVP